jgi:hypothetical protein
MVLVHGFGCDQVLIAVLAAERRPEFFGALVLVAPSPRHIDDEGTSAASR